MEAASVGPAGLVEDGCAERAGIRVGVGEGCQGRSPGNVTVAVGVAVVTAFGENPFRAGVNFAEGEEVGGDVGVVFWNMFFGDGELVHKGEAEVLFFCAEVYFGKFVGVLLSSFPADLAAEAGFVAGGADAGDVLEEEEEDGFDEVPVFGAAGEESAEPEVVGAGFVDVKDGEVASAGSGDVEAKAEGGGRGSSVECRGGGVLRVA